MYIALYHRFMHKVLFTFHKWDAKSGKTADAQQNAF